MRLPSPQHAEVAARFAAKGGGYPAQLRMGFMQREHPDDPIPPLARLMRAGRGGSVRVKLLLSMLLVAKWPPHQTDVKASAWARLLDLRDPVGNGARVITDAMSALEVTGLLEVERRRSWPSVCKLLDERGTRAPYVRPGEPGPSHSVYVSVPTEFWTNGWIVTVEAAALTVFLIMLDQRGYPRSDEAFWLSPQQRSNRYGVSEDTLYSGARSLEALGLLSVARVPFSEVFDPTRVRNRYAPSWSTLSYSPTLLLGQSDSHAAGL